MNYSKAMVISATVAEVTKEAMQKKQAFSNEEERLLYSALHDEELAGTQERENARKILVASHLYMAVAFVMFFPYEFDSVEECEDLLLEGAALVSEAVGRWDIERGSFKACVSCQVKRLYRAFWKEHSMISQTSLQNYKKIERFERIFEQEAGRAATEEETAEALGVTPRMVRSSHSCRNAQAKTGLADGYEEKLEDAKSGDDLLRNLLNEEFTASVMGVVNRYQGDHAQIFRDIAGWVLNPCRGCGKCWIAEFIGCMAARGRQYDYQQVYRGCRQLAKVLSVFKLIPEGYVGLVPEVSAKERKKIRMLAAA